MYYVTRTGEDVTMYHSAWVHYRDAVNQADSLKKTFNRDYSVTRLELVYATITLRDEED